jgi:hypothetical protein
MPTKTPSLDWTSIEAQIVALAEKILSGYTTQALKDFNDFKILVTDDVQQWMVAYVQGTLSLEDLQELVMGEGDLLKLEGLKQTGLALIALDSFTEGVMKILVTAVIGAVSKTLPLPPL